MSDSELTSLTWLSSIDTGGVSGSDQKESNNNAGVIIVGEYHGGTNRPVSYSLAAARSRGTANYRSPGGHLRPPCSYSCLIAMALTASPTGCLPVNEIYHFIEQKYPFFKTAPDGWKNSIRHNLSMNQNFVKVLRSDGYQPRKGYHWAINPKRRQTLELEIERTLRIVQQDRADHISCRENFGGITQEKNSNFDHSRMAQILSIQQKQQEAHALLLINSKKPEMQPPDIDIANSSSFLQSHCVPLFTTSNGISKDNSQYYHHPNIEQVVITDETDTQHEDAIKPFEWVEKECIIKNEEEEEEEEEVDLSPRGKIMAEMLAVKRQKLDAKITALNSSSEAQESTPTISLESMLKDIENEEPIGALTPSSSSVSSTSIQQQQYQEEPVMFSKNSLPFAHYETTLV